MPLTTRCEGSTAQSQRTNSPVAPHICPNSVALRAPSKGELKGTALPFSLCKPAQAAAANTRYRFSESAAD